MILRLALLALVLLAAGLAGCQGVPAGSPLESLVATERAFSRRSVAEGTRAAFLAFFAEDGVNFSPGPVRTRATLSAQPAPATPPAVILEWAPITADVARAGDLGYTTGPWVRSERNEARKPLAWGWYFTVWKKQPDGSWKAAADIGTTSPAHTLPGPETFRAASPTSRAGAFQAPAGAADAAEILVAERRLSDAAASGALEAYLACATEEIRLHRNGVEPVVGAAAVRSLLSDRPAQIVSTPIEADISRSGDLGYAYGSYVARDQKAASRPEERGYYLRVWKRLAVGWRLVADISNPAPAQ